MESQPGKHVMADKRDNLDVLDETRFLSLAPVECTLNFDTPMKPSVSQFAYRTQTQPFMANQTTQPKCGLSGLHGPGYSDTSADQTLVQSHSASSLNVNQAIETLFAERQFLREKLNSLELQMKFGAERDSSRNDSAAGQHFGPQGCYGCAERDSQMHKLCATLGQAESEREEMVGFISEMQKDSNAKMRHLQSEMDSLKSELVSSHSKLQQLHDKNRALNLENKQFLQYKATLPTKNEYAAVKHELEDVTDKKNRLKEKLISVNKQVENLRSVERANQSLIVERNGEIELLMSKLHKSEENVRILESFISSNAGSDEELPHVTIARLTTEVSELSSDLTKHKKLVKQLRSALTKESSKYKQQLAEIKTESAASLLQYEQLKEEIQKVQLEYRLLKTSFEEVSQENNFLRQENETTLTENQKLKNLQLSEKFQTNKIVANQLSSCLRQMRELFSMIQKFESDKDLDISDLIGCESGQSMHRNADEQTGVPIEEKVATLEKEIKLFRENLSDQAASLVGSECKLQ